MFIHPSADGHLGCVYFLASMESAAVNSDTQVFVRVNEFISLRCRLGVELLRSDDDSRFNFLRRLFSKAAAPFCCLRFLTVGVLLFLTPGQQRLQVVCPVPEPFLWAENEGSLKGGLESRVLYMG